MDKQWLRFKLTCEFHTFILLFRSAILRSILSKLQCKLLLNDLMKNSVVKG